MSNISMKKMSTYVTHPEKKSRAPRAAGHYYTGNELLAKVSQDEDRRVPGLPDAQTLKTRPDKESKHGLAGVDSRLHDYKYESVDTSDPSHLRSEHVPLNEDAGSIGSSGGHGRMPNTRCKDTVSSAGGKPPKA